LNSTYNSATEWKHLPPFTSSNAVFANPKGAESGRCTTAVVHTSDCLSFNPQNCELAEKQHQEDDVHNGKSSR